MQKHVNLVDLVKSFQTNIFLQNLASIQKKTSPTKFAHLAEKSANGSISNLSTKEGTELRRKCLVTSPHPHVRVAACVLAVDWILVERFDIEPFSDFSAK